MRYRLKLASAAAVAVLLTACDDGPTTVPATATSIPGRVRLALSADSATAVESLAADVVGRLAPVVAPNVASPLDTPLNDVARGVSARDDVAARQGLERASRALDSLDRGANTDPDVAALRLALDALRTALEPNPRHR